MSESSEKTPETHVVIIIYGMEFNYTNVREFAHKHKTDIDEIVHLITTKLDWIGQFLNVESVQSSIFTDPEGKS